MGGSIKLENLPGLASDGQDAFATMVIGQDGALYGTTGKGGLNQHGTLYRVVPGAKPTAGTFYSFDAETYSPDAPMAAANDGYLYGVTSVWKKLYRVKPGLNPTVGLFPIDPELAYSADTHLVLGSDGALYGTILGNQNGAGGIYRITPGAVPKIKRVWSFAGGGCLLASSQNKTDHNVFQKVMGTFVDAAISSASATSIVIRSCSVGHLPLVVGSDGNLYGATMGNQLLDDRRFLYRVIPGDNPRVEILSQDHGEKIIRAPTSMVAAPDGLIYGTTSAGGAHDMGILFSIKPGVKPKVTTLMSIESAQYQNLKINIAGKDGKLYGLSEGGTTGCGSVFVLTPGASPRVTTLLSFTSERADPNCTYSKPNATLAAGSDKTLYGTLTPIDPIGSNDNTAVGGIFQITTGPNPVATRLLSFSDQLGYKPVAPLLVAKDGNLYGTTINGGTTGEGTIYRFNPANSNLENIFSFDARTYLQPQAALIEGPDGDLYGAAADCCDREGVMLKVHGGAEPYAKWFYSFSSGASDGGPTGWLFAGGDGNLYGPTRAGGAGSIYKVTTGNTNDVSTVFNFNATTGMGPAGPLTAGRDNRFYGTISRGGTFKMGSIYAFTPGAPNPVSVAASYDQKMGYPNGFGLLAAADGRLYEATGRGGNNCGGIYRYEPGMTGSAGKVEVLYNFDRHTCYFHSQLVAAKNNDLYVASLGNSSDDDGKIFKVTIGDKPGVIVVGSFSDGNRFGHVSLFAGNDGNVYGLAYDTREDGELFRVTTGVAASIKTLLTFDAKQKPDTIVKGKDGYYYGTAQKGGAYGLGALLRYKPGNNAFDLLYSFSNTGDGAYPITPLVLHTDGYFYGLTKEASMRSNGHASLGRVFRFRPPE